MNTPGKNPVTPEIPVPTGPKVDEPTAPKVDDPTAPIIDPPTTNTPSANNLFIPDVS